MKTQVIVDTGPLVALLNRTDSFHRWTMEHLTNIAPPMLTCEAVIAEASHLARQLPGGRIALLEMLGEGFLSIGMQVADHHTALLSMVRRYADVPMSLADACLVRLADINPHSEVFTLDGDFGIYRKSNRQVINVISPRA